MDCGGFAHWGDCGEEAQGKIVLEIAGATREQEMWERRFKVLYAQHPIWRTADNDGSWGLRDFLRYAGEVCGFEPEA